MTEHTPTNRAALLVIIGIITASLTVSSETLRPIGFGLFLLLAMVAIWTLKGDSTG